MTATEPGVRLVDGKWEVVPVHFGPTWEENPAWDGVTSAERYLLPEITIGWQVLAWVEANLLNRKGKPFTPTHEQARFILWWYAIDENGEFVYRDGIFQRLKGHGKDPLAAVLSAVEFVGPCRFAGWCEKAMPDLELEAGDPYAEPNPAAWIQIAAVSKDQTRNTLTIFPSIFTAACKSKHGIDIGKEIIYAYHGARRIEAVTSSPRALEGGRPTFVIRNETHHWLLNNEGHEMAAVIERNATKSEDGAARALSITNAYEPSEDSVAQRQREAWENEEAGLSIKTGVLYDSLEAPADAQLVPPKQRKSDPDPTDEEVIEYLSAVVAAIRGDSTWLNVDRIVKSILDRVNPPSRSRRFWLNQIVSAEDAWADPAAIEAAEDPLARDARRGEADQLRAGWLVDPAEDVVMFFDGSKSDDATALVGCRLSDEYLFTIGVWQKPAGDAGKGWVVPRNEVDQRVDEAFERFNVVAFFGDPSHTRDDDDTRFWDGSIDGWHRRYSDRLKLWATKSGDNRHSIMWDMTSPERTKTFVAAAERFITELERRVAGELAPSFRHDGHPALKQHLRNARRYPSRDGVSLWKGGRESEKKIDLAVCGVGAKMLARMMSNVGLEEEKAKNGEVWGLGRAGAGAGREVRTGRRAAWV